MPIIADSGVRSVDRMREGIVITFEDGRTAIYSVALLLSMFPQAKEIIPDEDDDLPL